MREGGRHMGAWRSHRLLEREQEVTNRFVPSFAESLFGCFVGWTRVNERNGGRQLERQEGGDGGAWGRTR